MHAWCSENSGSNMPLLSDIQQRIGYIFKKPEILEHALTHKSYANEYKVPYHNERLEFLGDAVLGLIISKYLMKTCPNSTEGDLSRLRAVIVSEPALAAIARDITLGDHILLGKGEEQTGGRNKDSLLADSLEALIAAVYLDADLDLAEELVLQLFEARIQKTCAPGGTLDYKTDLQELCQERLKQLPEYRLVSESGPDHQKQFDVEVLIRGRIFGRGTGRSKKEAEQRAAKEALSRLTGNSK